MNARHEIRLCCVDISPKYLAAGSMNDLMQFFTIRTNTQTASQTCFGCGMTISIKNTIMNEDEIPKNSQIP